MGTRSERAVSLLGDRQVVSVMEDYIQYEAYLIWGKLIKLSPEEMRIIIDDINSFRPSVFIGGQSCVIEFTVVYDNDSPHIQLNFSMDKAPLYEDGALEEGTLMFVDGIVVDRLKDALFAINLAYPGHIHFFRSTLYRDGNPVREFAFSTDISGASYQECKWIPFERLTIQHCWSWISTKTNFLGGISKTSIDRALHALSYESVANEDMYIFYIMLGLEAIYNDGSNIEESISSQMKRKVQSLLGDIPSSAVNDIKAMYRRRSSLVHGNANIYKCWGSDNCTEDEADKIDKERDYIITATGILIATIQKFIKANANVIKENVTVSLVTE